MREYVWLECTACGARNYRTQKETRGADRLEFHDADMGAAGDNRLLSRPVPLHLGRRALDPQIFGRQAEARDVVEFDVEALFGAVEAQLDRPWVCFARAHGCGNRFGAVSSSRRGRASSTSMIGMPSRIG